MTEQEKYLEGHRNCGIKVGDRVRVMRKAESNENGWGDFWAEDMDAEIGKTRIVVEDYKIHGFACQENLEENSPRWAYPHFVLEKI